MSDYRAELQALIAACEDHYKWMLAAKFDSLFLAVQRARAALDGSAVPEGREAVAVTGQRSDGWLPIDTAPRDNTEILASDYDAIEIVSWGICQGEWQDWECWSDREGRIMFPTWWRPLPEHPPLPEKNHD